jgi:hypothetical protein
MNDLNLRREKQTNKKRITSHPTEKDYPTITDLQCQEYQITANLSDGRTISVPTA